ncbi:MAG: DNA repair and recombination protein RadA [Candidatus Sigynarchaeota archaeon]
MSLTHGKLVQIHAVRAARVQTAYSRMMIMVKNLSRHDDDMSSAGERGKEPAESGAAITIEHLLGFGPGIVEKLSNNGFSNLRAIATLSTRMLQEQSGIGERTAQKIIQAARGLCKIEFQTANDVLERRKRLGRITTSSTALDELLGGGIECGAITELVGEFRTGKTQIAHQVCLNVQLPLDRGGLGGRALYVDTESTFRPERLVQMAIGMKIDVKEALGNVIYGRAFNSEHQITIIKQARQLVETRGIKLLVVDSIINHFRAEYIGLGALGPRQQLLNMHLHQIQQLVDTYGIAALVTNQVQARPDTLFDDPIQPAGGNIMAHCSTYRLQLRKGRGDTRFARIIDAPGLPEAEISFRLTEKGVQDVDE